MRRMAASFVVVPQWQGSGSSRAMRLIDGADAIRGDLPSKATRVVDVPMEAGESQDTGIHRFACLTAIRAATHSMLVDLAEPAVTIGGDCGVEFPAIEHALQRFGTDTAVVWFDAHADLNTPESSPSGAFHGMVLRALLGEGAPGLTLEAGSALNPGSIVLAGVRATDDAEDDFITSSGIRRIDPADVAGPAIVDAVRATGASRVYVHVDLDVIDPSEVSGIGYPEPFGVSVAALVDAIKALRAEFPLAGAGITEFAPSSPDAASDDLGVSLRIVGALTARTPLADATAATGGSR
jgi:arginase